MKYFSMWSVRVLMRQSALAVCLVSAFSVLGGAEASLEDQFLLAEQNDSEIVPLLKSINQQLGAGGGAEAIALADRAQPFLQQVYFSGRTFVGEEDLGVREHVVARGEYASTIAKKYGVDHRLFPLMNPGFRANALQVGQRLRIIDLAQDADLIIIIQRKLFRAMLVRRPHAGHGGPQLLACFPVGLGKADRATPLGMTTIANKVLQPEWTHPDTKEVIPAGDPRNVLGGYWVGVNAGPDKRFQSIGFHGYTGAPSDDWIAQPGSRGCVRMLQPDINLLFALARPGVQVVVME